VRFSRQTSSKQKRRLVFLMNPSGLRSFARRQAEAA